MNERAWSNEPGGYQPEPSDSDVRITTNDIPRDLISGHQLTAAERAEYDFINWQAVEDGAYDPEFFRYRGTLYYLESEGRPEFAPGWDGYLSDTFFSGVVWRFPREDGHVDFERIVIGSYYAG